MNGDRPVLHQDRRVFCSDILPKKLNSARAIADFAFYVITRQLEDFISATCERRPSGEQDERRSDNRSHFDLHSWSRKKFVSACGTQVVKQV
jgi:hypothetical protein